MINQKKQKRAIRQFNEIKKLIGQNLDNKRFIY